MTKREFDLSDEDAVFIQSRVEAGAGDADAVLGEAIKLLRAEEARIDRWMREDVLPTHERWKAGLEKEHSLDDVFERLQDRIKDRAAQKAS